MFQNNSVKDAFTVLKSRKLVFLKNSIRRIFQEPDRPCLVRILKLFARLDIKATFFIVGYLADRHPGIIKEIASQGHEIASHGYEHRAYQLMTSKQIKKDIEKSISTFRKLGIEIKGLRPPYLSFHPALYKIAQEQNLEYVSGSVSFDFPLYKNKVDENIIRVGNIYELPISSLSDYDLISFQSQPFPKAVAYWKKNAWIDTTYLFHLTIVGKNRSLPMFEGMLRFLQDHFGIITMNQKAEGEKGNAITLDIGMLDRCDLLHLLFN